MTDVYDKRAAQARNARPEARSVAATIARTVPIEGLDDPAIIAKIIETELRRFEDDPDAPIFVRPWKGIDPPTRRTTGELLDDTTFDLDAGVARPVVLAAGAATIAIARAYGTVLRPFLSEFLEWTPTVITKAVTSLPHRPRVPGAQGALLRIQEHRRHLGMQPLDVRAAGWTDQDVLDEADRIERLPNPLQDLKHRLI